jgi:RNA polymerase sigma-70 factor (ECF subfamily)
MRIVRGAEPVADSASLGGRGGQALGRVARRALIDGAPGAVVFEADGTPVTILAFTVADDRVTGIDITLDPVRVAALVG